MGPESIQITGKRRGGATAYGEKSVENNREGMAKVAVPRGGNTAASPEEGLTKAGRIRKGEKNHLKPTTGEGGRKGGGEIRAGGESLKKGDQ